ncbi:MAG: tetratricopeptide repeat protein [Novosphingobium sp.]|nr:tetratricopeptide repeat protein [Novosphingobium sp.]
MPLRWGCHRFRKAAGQYRYVKAPPVKPVELAVPPAKQPHSLTQRPESAVLALTPNTPSGNAPANSKDAAAQETFLREVDDALREDQLRSLLLNRGRPILALVVGGLVGLGGWLWYNDHTASVRDQQSETFVTALDALEANRTQAAKQGMDPLAKSGNPGYRAAVQISDAAIAEQAGKADEAAKLFAAVSADGTLPGPYRDLATVREVATNFDKLPPQTVIDRLKPLAVPGKPWFGSAGELVALAYLKQNKTEAAGALLASIAKDKAVPDTLRRRTRQLAGQLGVDAVDNPVAAVDGSQVQ